MGITENAAYLKGLFDGYELDKNTKEGKIMSGMLDLIADMADKISALEADNRDLHEYVEELDQDLGAVEEDLYFDDDEDDYIPSFKDEEYRADESTIEAAGFAIEDVESDDDYAADDNDFEEEE